MSKLTRPASHPFRSHLAVSIRLLGFEVCGLLPDGRRLLLALYQLLVVSKLGLSLFRKFQSDNQGWSFHLTHDRGHLASVPPPAQQHPREPRCYYARLPVVLPLLVRPTTSYRRPY
jgi:hypothetical protein